jgi:hypothetical protein
MPAKYVQLFLLEFFADGDESFTDLICFLPFSAACSSLQLLCSEPVAFRSKK